MSTGESGRTGGEREKVIFAGNLGVCKYSSGDVYEGRWRDNRKSGKGSACGTLGTLRYRSGDVYEGEFKSDQKSGEGALCAQC